MWSPELNRAEEKTIRRRAALMRAWRRLEEMPEGKLVLADLFATCGLLEPSHTIGDAYETAFREGRRSIALHALERLRWTETELLALARRRTTDTVENAGEG